MAEDAFGQRQPADIRKAGQYTAWKRTMSLPMTCRSIGQYFLRGSASFGKPVTVR